ncbi:GpE family phage tail protein [Kaustia mangrovi]|uniref:GpE family phage tail protein n=1 Tax=Kaustia mangrovi TaxID=2593653 RepID=A0A7S8C8K2_9HYPH|nr:GpE family phage tail protein [Kaustia mangrovi]
MADICAVFAWSLWEVEAMAIDELVAWHGRAMERAALKARLRL